MSVRILQKGPVAVYLFRRTRDDAITQEIPAIIPPQSGAPTPSPTPPPDPASGAAPGSF
jgi:hypothetical protein